MHTTHKHKSTMNVFNNKFSEISGYELNKLNNNKSFYKIINKEKRHYGFTYKEGLNLDNNEFNHVSKCQKGGLYFTTLENIFKFMEWGIYYCEVNIPNEAVCYIEDNKIKANMLTIISFIKTEELEDWHNLDFCRLAIKENIDTIHYVKAFDEKMLTSIISQCPSFIQLINKKYHIKGLNIYNDIVTYDGLLLEYLDDSVKTYEICLKAINNTKEAFIFIPDSIKVLHPEIIIQCIEDVQLVLNHIPFNCTSTLIWLKVLEVCPERLLTISDDVLRLCFDLLDYAIIDREEWYLFALLDVKIQKYHYESLVRTIAQKKKIRKILNDKLLMDLMNHSINSKKEICNELILYLNSEHDVYYEENKKKIKEEKKKKMKEEKYEKSKEYYEKNKEKIAEKCKEHCEKMKEKNIKNEIMRQRDIMNCYETIN